MEHWKSWPARPSTISPEPPNQAFGPIPASFSFSSEQPTTFSSSRLWGAAGGADPFGAGDAAPERRKSAGGLDKARIQVRLTLDEARQTKVSVAPVPLDEKTGRNPLLDFT